MKIQFIAPSIEGSHDWPGRTAPPLAQAAADGGHTVTLLHTGKTADEKVTGKLHVQQFARGRPEFLCPSRDLARFLTSSAAACDVIHHYGVGLRPLYHAARKARTDRVPLVVSPRGTLAPWRQHGYRRIGAQLFVHPRALASIAGWHALSTAEAADIKAAGFTQPVVVVPDGVALPSEVSLVGSREHWHKLCPRCSNRPTALFHGRLHSRKRVLELIDLWLENAPPEWILLIAGSNDEYTRVELRDYVHRTIGDDRIVIEDSAGHPAPYAAANLYLVPALKESFGHSTGQALAAGIPVLTTVASPWQGFETAGAGWRVGWDDFATALKSALNEDLGALKARGMKGRQWIDAHHSWNCAAAAMVPFYDQLRNRPARLA